MSATVVPILLILLFLLMIALMYRESQILDRNYLRQAVGNWGQNQYNYISEYKKTKCIGIARWQRKWIIFLIVSGVLLCAFRDVNNTYDTENYINWYNGWDVSSFSAFFNFGGEVEVGFEFVSRVIKLLCFGNVPIYLGVIALIVLSLFAAAIWMLTDRRLTVFMLLYCMYGFYYSYIVLRQGIAMGIILYAIACIRQNKRFYPIKFLLAVFVAMLFHRAAVICIAMLPFLGGKIKIKKIVLVCVLILVVSLTATRNTVFLIAKIALKLSELPVFASVKDKIYIYFSTINLESSKNLTTLVILFIIIAFGGVNKKDDNTWNIFIGIELIGALIMGLLAGWGIAIRFSQFFLLAHCFILPDCTHYIGKRWNRLILVAVSAFYIYNMVQLSALAH